MINRLAIATILQHWQRTIGELQAYESVEQNPNVFTVTTERGENFILKRVGGSSFAAHVESHACVIRHLHAAHIPVAMPILADHQQIFVEHGDGLYTLSPLLPTGMDEGMVISSEQLYLNMGRAVAQMHRALASYPGEILSCQMDFAHRALAEAVPVIQSRLDAQRRTQFDRVLSDVAQEMRMALTDLPVHYIHGDCHGGNIVLYNGDVSGFIDLDHFPRGPHIYDISYLLADRVKSHLLQPSELESWLNYFDCLIVGYEQIQPLTVAEKDAIWVGMIAVQMIFVEWFFTHNEETAAEKNLAVLYWIYQHKQTFLTRISGKEESV